jgi:hypothetical protein
MKTNIGFWSYLAQLFLEWKIFETKVAEKIKTQNFYSINVPRKSCRLRGNVEKYCIVGQATDNNMAHAYCKLDT